METMLNNQLEQKTETKLEQNSINDSNTELKKVTQTNKNEIEIEMNEKQIKVSEDDLRKIFKETFLSLTDNYLELLSKKVSGSIEVKKKKRHLFKKKDEKISNIIETSCENEDNDIQLVDECNNNQSVDEEPIKVKKKLGRPPKQKQMLDTIENIAKNTEPFKIKKKLGRPPKQKIEEKKSQLDKTKKNLIEKQNKKLKLRNNVIMSNI